MTTSLPRILTALDLPSPELQAAALDGDVYRLDQVFCSMAEFDVPWRRAEAAAAVLGGGLVVAASSAAWVWGAADRAPRRHEAYFSPGPRRAASSLPRGCLVRQIVLASDDVVDLGVVGVTSPCRTAVDLVRGADWSPSLAAVTRRLIADPAVTRDACEAILERRAHLPYVRRARLRLDELFAAPTAA